MYLSFQGFFSEILPSIILNKTPTSAFFQLPYYGPDTKIAFAAWVWSQGLCSAISWSVSVCLSFYRLIHILIWDVFEGLYSGNLVMKQFLIGYFFLLLVGWVELPISVVLKSGPVACDIYSVLQFRKGKSLLSINQGSYWLPKNAFHRNAWQHGLCSKMFKEILWFMLYRR